MTIARMTSFSPGQSPPQVTIPQRKPRRVEEQRLPRARRLHRRRIDAAAEPGLHVLERRVIEDALMVGGEANVGHRRPKATLTEPRYGEIEIAVTHMNLLTITSPWSFR